ncbi:MAG: hypothetical protein AB203_03375 [Parcubacteria bacterium C7867-008]|nr:MAG: hypothetical protein AB203_03375 [Parcubacteria bacterium C7867-008]
MILTKSPDIFDAAIAGDPIGIQLDDRDPVQVAREWFASDLLQYQKAAADSGKDETVIWFLTSEAGHFVEGKLRKFLDALIREVQKVGITVRATFRTIARSEIDQEAPFLVPIHLSW